LFGAPFVAAGIGFSRFVARFARAKRLTAYALVCELLTCGVAIALLIHHLNGGAAAGTSADDSKPRQTMQLSAELSADFLRL
jgi:hypothetical protein